MKRYIKIIYCLVCVFALEVRADFASAIKNYENKQFPEAMQEFKRLAALGHKQSQLNIGAMYIRAESVAKNLVDAYAWIALSAENNDADNLRARDMVFSKLDDQQKVKAETKFKEIMAIYGNQALRITLLPKYSSGKVKVRYASFKGAPNIPDSAVSEKFLEYELECDVDKQGHIRNYTFLKMEGVNDPQKLANYLATMKSYPQQLNGNSIWTFNTVQAVKGAGHGRVKQLVKEINEDIREGFSPEIDWSNAENIFQHERALHYEKQSDKIEQTRTLLLLHAAQMGHIKAQTTVALNVLYGNGYEQDRKKGIAWLLALAESKDNSSLYMVASLLYEGEIVDSDKPKAIELLQQATTQQHAKSKMKLAWILATEKDLNIYNPQKALQLAKEVHPDYLDRITAYETLAAAQAANGLFDTAIITQEKAVDFAKDVDARLAEAKVRLNIYKQHK
jgi:uncharacterized protein